MSNLTIDYFMSKAVSMAEVAFQNDEVPVGAVIVKDGKIIGKGFNQVIEKNSVSSHAEINAINDASQTIQNYRLIDCDIYVTLEPCHMCAKAIVDARVNKIIFATPEPKTGSLVSIDNILERLTFNHQVSYEYGLFEEESSNLLKDFFKQRRKN